ncbi:hypothetical protein R4J00_02785 [Brachyspira intermedia]|uniref:hypothetical protein n=1 Tax=Brachyspira intermedia TaxID=84377 RepID=UPI0030063F37
MDDSRNSVTINFRQELYRWVAKMVDNAKADPLNYSNATFGGFVQACVAKAKKEYEEKGSEMQKLNKKVNKLEKEIEDLKIKVSSLENNK